ncbi:hypothetical protein VNO77_35508 [Canavalia gladiata]|uniref:Uncharacterized protein n=1 Tax=Canavalia gladiata TaxID=3824 RepID=A0AAN9Q2D4_CANGL
MFVCPCFFYLCITRTQRFQLHFSALVIVLDKIAVRNSTCLVLRFEETKFLFSYLPTSTGLVHFTRSTHF